MEDTNTGLAVADNAAVAVASRAMVAANVDDKALTDLSGAGFAFLPRLQLCGSSSNLCKESKIPVGMYAYIKGKGDAFDNLGGSVNCFLYGLRLKAMKFTKDKILSYYDPNGKEFQAIKAVSLEKDSGCLAGPEYLCYIPGKGWCTLYLTSKSARNESPQLKGLLGKTVTLTAFLAENAKKQKWHVIRSAPCSIPLEAPPDAEIEIQQTRFLNAKDSAEEAVPEAAQEGQRDM